MERLLLENVRCFDGPRDIRLAPITVLVGENSTGKSTLLACIRAAWDIAVGKGNPDFNEEPFALGSFEHIANFPSYRTGRSSSFTIGATHRVPDRDVTVEGSFSDKDSQPALESWTAHWADRRVTLDIGGPQSSRLTLSVSGGTASQWKLDRPPSLRASLSLPWYIWFELSGLEADKPIDDGVRGEVIDEMREVLQTLDDVFLMRPVAFPPIRSRPERTYDPSVSHQDQSGAHVPLALRQVLSSDSDSAVQVKNALVAFGKDSGLFNGLKVRDLRKQGDPFQIQVRNVGPDRNLIDVGYGVSQILPVIFDAAQGKPGQAFLFQQPEVHLHPKAQAEFATAIAGLVGNHDMQAVIETHSDFILDRLRIEARSGEKISPDDVAILYFERKGTSVKVHEMGLDDQANLTNVPRGFRDFFLREQRQLLGL